MEIERKFLVTQLPSLEHCDSQKILQAYISIEPVIRIRQADCNFFLTVKSKVVLYVKNLNSQLQKMSLNLY